jgi:hypothetical protein
VISKSEIVLDSCSDAPDDRYNASDDRYKAQDDRHNAQNCYVAQATYDYRPL